MEFQLHIGLEKTGTTTIQKFMAANRRVLHRSRIRYPRSPGALNHARLAVYAVNAGKHDSVRKRLVDDGGQEQFDEVFVNAFAAEIDRFKDLRMILSNEHCSSRLKTVEEIERLKSLFARHGQVTRVLVYLRRQDDLMLSQYSTSIKMGAARRFKLPSPMQRETRYNFAAIIRKWEQVFGERTVMPRLFQRDAFYQGDLLLDFCQAMEIPIETLDFEIKPQNTSLSAEGLEILRLINERTERLKQQDRSDDRMVRWVSSNTPGPTFSLGAGARRTLMDLFEDSNEEVRRRFFPERKAPLFDPVDEGIPEVQMPDVSREQVDDILARAPEPDPPRQRRPVAYSRLGSSPTVSGEAP